jgi:RND family efflux transporter MFP subunit
MLAAAAFLAGCGGAKAPEAKQRAEAPAVRVKTGKAENAQVPEVYEATGTVRARTTTVLAARVMGYLREVRVRAGDTVRAGQVVAVLEVREIESGLRQAEAARAEARSALPEVDNAIAAAKAQLDLAGSTHNRMKTLFDQKSITNQEFDEVAARLRMAEANHQMALARKAQLEQKIRQADEAVAQAQISKGYAEVAAPFAGTVVERKAEPGMLASPGLPIAVIEQAGDYVLEAAIEEARLASIRPGTPVKVAMEATGKTIEARVREIVPALDPGSRTFTAKIDLPAGVLLRTGMFGRALFSFGGRPVIVVPASAVVEMGQVRRVYVADNGVARSRLVSTGLSLDGRVEILSGLSAGETVIVEAPSTLADGSRIEQ